MVCRVSGTGCLDRGRNHSRLYGRGLASCRFRGAIRCRSRGTESMPPSPGVARCASHPRLPSGRRSAARGAQHRAAIPPASRDGWIATRSPSFHTQTSTPQQYRRATKVRHTDPGVCPPLPRILTGQGLSPGESHRGSAWTTAARKRMARSRRKQDRRLRKREGHSAAPALRDLQSAGRGVESVSETGSGAVSCRPTAWSALARASPPGALGRDSPR